MSPACRAAASFSLLLLMLAAARAKLAVEQVPLCELRARVVTERGTAPAEDAAFTFTVAHRQETMRGAAWSGWAPLTSAYVRELLDGYPNGYMGGFPFVIHVDLGRAAAPPAGRIADPTAVELEARFVPAAGAIDAAPVTALRAELFSPDLGLLVWVEDGAPRIATFAGYNRRFWKELEGAALPVAARPTRFPILDCFYGGDGDNLTWREGFAQLASMGLTGICNGKQSFLAGVGLHMTGGGVYNPPAGYFDTGLPETAPEAIDAWAAAQAKALTAGGYAPKDISIFGLADEPGWYYPYMLAQVQGGKPAFAARFRDYLQAQGLQPADLGAADRDALLPIGRTAVKDLPSRRLFYWSMRFYSWDAAHYFAASTRALEKAISPETKIFVNWNNFAGTFYYAGPGGNNADAGLDAGMGALDWMEFGRLRGATMLWSEDWFGDEYAYAWSQRCARLRSAAARGGLAFGGYIVPRTAGSRPDGIVQKILAVAGSGAKAIDYFTFGPEYNFPGNCYSFNARVLPAMARAHGMIARAEDLLWPGRPPANAVGFLWPRTAQVWSVKPFPADLPGVAAKDYWKQAERLDYPGDELERLYLPLQHANVPLDFVDEDELTPAGLKPYRVLYVSEPTVPEEGQRALLAWVRRGGVLVTTTQAITADRYDAPCALVAQAARFREIPRQPAPVVNPAKVAPLPVQTPGGNFTAAGACAVLQGTFAAKEVLADFADGTPAVVRRRLGRGWVVHFAFLPGASYAATKTGARGGLPVGFSDDLRTLVTLPLRYAGVTPPVTADPPQVETPVLLAKDGAAVTVLNWTGDAAVTARLVIRVPFAVRRLESVRRGPLPFTRAPGGIACTLPLAAADILLLRR